MKELDKARETTQAVDAAKSPVKPTASVLML